MKRRTTIADNPLDVLMPRSSRAGQVKTPSTPLRAAAPARRQSKQRFTVHLPADLVDAVKNAAIALSGPPERLTLAQLAENAFRREVERLQKQHQGGKPFARRSANSVGGRPIKV